jgi:two-component system response regulator FixJ
MADSVASGTLDRAEQRTVAVVDDDTAVCDATRFLLEAYNFDVLTFLNGADFLRENPDVACVIVDYRMPGMDGLDVIAELRQRGSTVPAIMITGTRFPALERRVAELGVQQVLQKPISDQMLLCAIREELD